MMPQDELPENKIPVIRVQAMPSDLNQGGTVFGGWIMSQVILQVAYLPHSVQVVRL